MCVSLIVETATTLTMLVISAMPLQAAMVSTFIMWGLNFFAHVKSADPKYLRHEASLVPSDQPQEFNAWGRVAGNMVESVPIALIVLWGAVLSGGHALALTIIIYSYTGLRFLFAILYSLHLQPWRTLAFVASQACVATAGVFALLAAFNIYPAVKA